MVLEVGVDVRSSATRRVDLAEIQRVDPWFGASLDAGDVVLARVKALGRHRAIELFNGVEHEIAPGEVAAVVIGRRYATDEFHGEIPDGLGEGGTLHLLNVGGVVGKVKKSTSTVTDPTTLTYIGSAIDPLGKKLSTFDSSVSRRGSFRKSPKDLDVLLVVGSGMEVGKTSSASMAIEIINGKGCSVGGAKLTGTSRMKDLLRMKKSGAEDIVDFLDAGYPSTFGCSRGELEGIFDIQLDYLEERGVDIVVMEVADGVFQRETEEVLSSKKIMERVKMIIAASPDSMAAYGMLRYLSDIFDIVPDFISGVITSAPLCVSELKEKTKVPILSNSAKSKDKFIRLIRERFSRCRKI